MQTILRALILMTVVWAVPAQAFLLKGDVDLADMLEPVDVLVPGNYGMVSPGDLTASRHYTLWREGKGYRMVTASQGAEMQVSLFVMPKPLKDRGGLVPAYIVQSCVVAAAPSPRCGYNLLGVLNEPLLHITELAPGAELAKQGDTLRERLKEDDGAILHRGWLLRNRESSQDLLTALDAIRSPPFTMTVSYLLARVIDEKK